VIVESTIPIVDFPDCREEDVANLAFFGLFFCAGDSPEIADIDQDVTESGIDACSTDELDNG